MTTPDTTGLPELPTNLAQVTRRIRACESEVPAQLVLEYAMIRYAGESYRAAQRARPVQSEQELVAVVVAATEVDLEGKLNHLRDLDFYQDELDCLPVGTKLYASPPQRQPLTHEQRIDLLTAFEPSKSSWNAESILIDMVEAEHGIGEKHMNKDTQQTKMFLDEVARRKSEKREWKGLTDEEYQQIQRDYFQADQWRGIEAKLKEKNL